MSSSDSSPSLLNLREFRISKKPTLTHNSPTSTESMNPNPDRDPDDPDPVCKATESVAKDGSGEAEKKVEENGVKTTATVLEHSSVYRNSRFKKTAEIIEKEKQMKYLLELFPGLDAMKIHNILSVCKFDINRAVEELSKTYGNPVNNPEFDRWKKKYDEEQSLKVKLEAANTAALRETHLINMKRKEPPTPVEVDNSKIVKKQKVIVLDSDDSSNEKEKFDDSRVFNSDDDSDTEVTDELTPTKKAVLEFLQNSNSSELQMMASCSKRKVDALMELRPFKGWVDLVDKLQNNKYLNTDLLNAAEQVLSTRDNIRVLMKKCTNLALQLERAVAAGAGVKQQPRNLNPLYKLTNYQLVGLNWLAVLHAQNVNGILADEMGLGKTVQVIAFLAHLKEIGAVKGTHLIVVPSSTLDNWASEFQRWCPMLKVFMYYGSTEERKQYRVQWWKGEFASYDVVLTTYTMVGNSGEERKMFRITKMHYVVFDEAHMLKNMNTQRYENLIRINASNRILLTGTPLQNNLLELMSLLVFVMPKMFAEKVDDLKNLFQKNLRVKQDDNLPSFEKEQIDQAKRIMKPFVLRRLKQNVLQDLPKKTDSVLRIPLAPTQKEQYENLVSTFQNATKEKGNYNYNGVTMMSDLRKLSNHPLLLRYHYQYEDLPAIAQKLARDPLYKDTKEQYIIDDLAYMSDFEIHTMTKVYASISEFGLPDNLITTSGKFLYLDKKLEELKEEGHRVLIFSQYVILLNVLEEYMKIRDHSYLRLDGSTAVNTRRQLIDEYTQDESIFAFLLSTKAGGLGINLTAADTVIIHDIDFNPYNDKQAEDRCHRMGQTKPVDVYRLVSQGTIEEGMWQMNKEKLKLEKDITTDETDNPDVKSVVRLLSSALGIDSSRATDLCSPKKKS